MLSSVLSTFWLLLSTFFPQDSLSPLPKNPHLWGTLGILFSVPSFPSLSLPDASIRKKNCWEASADGCITQVSFMRLLPYPLASITRSLQSQLIRFSPSNLPCRQTAAAVSDGRRKRKEVRWYECDGDRCTCHKRNEVLTSRKRFATLFLFSTMKRFHSYRVETVFLCFFWEALHYISRTISWLSRAKLLAWYHGCMLASVLAC